MDKLTLVAAIARVTLDAHGLTDWGFGYSVSHRRLGQCKYHQRRIVLSRYHVEHDSMASVLDTVNHEVAHALTRGHGHDDVWAAKAAELGATPKACGATLMPTTWTADCPCGLHFRKHRILRRKLHSYQCSSCKRPVTWVRN